MKPTLYERAAFPDYWLASPESRSLSTKVGTNRTNWDLRYDDPPGYNADIVNQMNTAPGQVTPGPHGPQALPGTYTLKLLVDGATYTQTLVVHNDPRVGESATVMAALRAQNKLMMSAYQGMKDADAGNSEVAARARAGGGARGRQPAAGSSRRRRRRSTPSWRRSAARPAAADAAAAVAAAVAGEAAAPARAA